MPVAHIGHVELLVPDIDASTDFFEEMLGLYVADRVDGSVFMRAWQDYDHHTLVLKEGERTELGHIGWRVPTKDDALEIARALEGHGIETHWGEAIEGVGHGEGLRFTTPGGAPFELYWEVEYFESPPELRSRFPSHPSLIATRGAAARRFDHVTLSVNDPRSEQEFLTDVLGIHHRYYLETNDGTRMGSWLSRTNISHEIALTFNGLQTGAHMHHLAYYVQSSEDVIRTANFLADRSVALELGPANHATSGATCLYFREPSGHRVEIWTGGLLIFDPDWKPQRWGEDVAAALVDLWGNLPKEGFFGGSPVADARVAAAAGS